MSTKLTGEETVVDLLMLIDRLRIEVKKLRRNSDRMSRLISMARDGCRDVHISYNGVGESSWCVRYQNAARDTAEPSYGETAHAAIDAAIKAALSRDREGGEG